MSQSSSPLLSTSANTYAPLDELRRLYEPVLNMDKVVGLVVGTRPDCVDERMLDYFAKLAEKHYVMLEYGVESTLDRTLERINRGHTYAESEWAIKETAKRGIHTGAHIILGLPGEGREELMQQAAKLSELPLTTLKLHQLQLIHGTRMAEEYALAPEEFSLFSVEDYIETVVDYVERLRPNMVLERFASQSPKELLIAPDWGLKNYELVEKIKRRMLERDTWQGKKYRG